MPKTWIKLYTEMISDPKVRSLRAESCWCLVGTYILAGLRDDGSLSGRLELTPDEPMTDELIADLLHVDLATWKDAKCSLLRLGILAEENGCLVVRNFRKRQESADPKAAQRMQRYRERNVTRNSERTLRVEAEAEAEAECTAAAAGVTRNSYGENSVTITPLQQAVSSLSEDPRCHLPVYLVNNIVAVGVEQHGVAQVIAGITELLEKSTGRRITENALRSFIENAGSHGNGIPAPVLDDGNRAAIEATLAMLDKIRNTKSVPAPPPPWQKEAAA